MTSFDQLGRHRARPAFATAAALWLLLLSTSAFEAVLIWAGIMTFLFNAFAALDVDSGSRLVQLTLFGIVIIGAAASYPAAARFAHTTGPRALRARPLEPGTHVEGRLGATFEKVGIATGCRPRVHLIDAPWLNACSLGLATAHEPVVITTTAATQLSPRDQETLAAMLVAESVIGRTTATWRAVRGPGQAFVLLIRPLRQNWRVATACAAGFQVPWILADESPIDAGIATAVALLPFCALIFAAAVLWLGAMGEVVDRLGERQLDVVDVGALSILREPSGWAESLQSLSKKSTAPPLLDRFVAAWVLPITSDEAAARIHRATRDVDGVRAAIGEGVCRTSARREARGSSCKSEHMFARVDSC